MVELQSRSSSEPPSSATSPSLIARVRAGEASAWDRVVTLYAPLVFHWCRRARLQAHDIEDVFQEVFRAVAEHVDEFRRDRPGDSFRGWLRAITANKVRDHFRRRQGLPAAAGGTEAQQRLQAVAEPAADDPSEDDLVSRQLRQALESLRGEFEDRTWTAFWQVQFDGREPKDVAAELGMTPAAVRKARYRVLQRLREELDGLVS